LVEVLARLIPDLVSRIQNVVRLGFLETAEGPWLRFLASNFYEVDAIAATPAVGALTLALAPGAGPYTFAPQSLIVASPAGRLYRNRDVVTLAPAIVQSGIPFVAESPGSDYNEAPLGSSFSLVTPYPGLRAGNPPLGVSGSWLLVPGTDDEDDESLRGRCRQRWSVLGCGANDDAYAFNARAASPAVARVRVLATTPTPGQVTVVIAGPNGPAPADVVASVQAYLDKKKPTCVGVIVASAAAAEVPIRGTLTVTPDALSTAPRAADAALDGYQASLGLGEPVRVARLIEVLMRIPGVLDVALALPGSNVTVPTTALGVLTPRDLTSSTA
jgi:uncharacterized phage protein gp47/JayE